MPQHLPVLIFSVTCIDTQSNLFRYTVLPVFSVTCIDIYCYLYYYTVLPVLILRYLSETVSPVPMPYDVQFNSRTLTTSWLDLVLSQYLNSRRLASAFRTQTPRTSSSISEQDTTLRKLLSQHPFKYCNLYLWLFAYKIK